MKYFQETTRCQREAEVIGLLLAACASSPPQLLTVSAAASLSDAFTEIAGAFEDVQPGVEVELNLASSGALAAQIRSGAPVDVFVSAAVVVMDSLESDGLFLDDTRQDIAGNRLVLVSPVDDQTLSGPDDLPVLDRIAIGNPELVPAGAYAQQSLRSLALWDQLAAQFVYGDSVREVLAWVERGEVEAGLVYATDAQLSHKVRLVSELPADSYQPITYPMAVVKGSPSPKLAAEFVAFVAGVEGQAILARHGFSPPPEAGS